LKGAYFDSAYLMKLYIPHADSGKVWALIRPMDSVYSSALCVAEVSCAFHRAAREGAVTHAQAASLRAVFSDDVSSGLIQLIPISEKILRSVEAVTARLPSTIFLRAGDAIHLATAQSEGFSDVWSNDRHMLKAAPHFGVTGSSV